MDHTTRRHPRRRIALAVSAVGAALCAALGGCTDSSLDGNASAISTNAPNTAGRWTPLQISDAASILTGPPTGMGTQQATCLVQFAAANLSWRQFQSYVAFLNGSGGIATPNGEQGAVVSTLSNYAVKCQTLQSGFASPSS